MPEQGLTGDNPLVGRERGRSRFENERRMCASRSKWIHRERDGKMPDDDVEWSGETEVDDVIYKVDPGMIASVF